MPTTPSTPENPALNNDVAGIIAWPPGIALTCLGIGGVLHWLFPIPVFPSLPARLVGGVLCVAAIALATWARRTMKAAGTNVHPTEPSLAIVSSGPFAYSRNPMYSSLLLMLTGIGLLINGLVVIFMVVPLFIILSWGVIAREERYLARRFGDTYLNYKQTVRRWF